MRVVYEYEYECEPIFNDNEKKIHIYSWKMMSEICNSMYLLQKEIYENEENV
jgi:hypothetical protein